MKWGEPAFSEVLLGGYLTMLSLLWGALLGGVGSWHKKHALPEHASTELPPLTICIPARDEAHQVGACVVAALLSDHPSFTVVVVDDCSTDGTAEAAIKAGNADTRLVVITARPPPAGWAGKPWACALAAAEATGTHLLFLDADVVIAPSAARRAASAMVARKLGLLSLFGTWTLGSAWERIAIPVVGWFVRGVTDLDAVNTPGRKEAFANGQFLLVDRHAYESVGGHAAVKDAVLEDVRLAEVMKQRGWPLGLYADPSAFSVRLYRNLREIFEGYTKNFYEGMGRRPHLAIVALVFLLVTAVLPYVLFPVVVFAPAALLAGMGAQWPWQVWMALVCGLPVAFRFRLDRADGRSGILAFTHPLGNAVLAAILIGSVFRVRSRWKGRLFHDGKAS